MSHIWARVNAFSANYAPRSAVPGSVAHFSMGKLISGFVEKSSPRYLSAQLIGWDVLDITWATTFRPAFLPRPADIELTPKLIARLPLLAGGAFPFPRSTLISNSVRLEVPTLDLPIWRERAAAAGTPRVSKFEFSDNNSLLGPIAEAHERQFNAYSSRYTSPSVAHSSVRGAPRSPPKNNRSMILNKIVFTPFLFNSASPTHKERSQGFGILPIAHEQMPVCTLNEESSTF